MGEPKQKEVEVSFTRRYTLIEKACFHCGTTFEGVGLKKYCSDQCRLQAAWKRNGAAYRERKKRATDGGETK